MRGGAAGRKKEFSDFYKTRTDKTLFANKFLPGALIDQLKTALASVATLPCVWAGPSEEAPDREFRPSLQVALWVLNARGALTRTGKNGGERPFLGDRANIEEFWNDSVAENEAISSCSTCPPDRNVISVLSKAHSEI